MFLPSVQPALTAADVSRLPVNRQISEFSGITAFLALHTPTLIFGCRFEPVRTLYGYALLLWVMMNT